LDTKTIKALLRKNAKVYMASRSKEKAKVAIKKLRAETGNEALFLQLDLADKASVRKAVAYFIYESGQNQSYMFSSIRVV